MKNTIHALLLATILPLVACGGGDKPAPSAPEAAKAAESGKAGLTVQRFDGGSIKVMTALSKDIVILNEKSSLNREWFVVTDPTAPLGIEGPAGTRVEAMLDRISNFRFHYVAGMNLKATEPITAFEARFIVFNVFGERLQTLSATSVADAKEKFSTAAQWNLWNEAHASEAFGSIGYIAAVRTAAGKVYQIDNAAVLKEVQKVAKRVTEADLEPPKQPPLGAKS